MDVSLSGGKVLPRDIFEFNQHKTEYLNIENTLHELGVFVIFKR